MVRFDWLIIGLKAGLGHVHTPEDDTSSGIYLVVAQKFDIYQAVAGEFWHSRAFNSSCCFVLFGWQEWNQHAWCTIRRGYIIYQFSHSTTAQFFLLLLFRNVWLTGIESAYNKRWCTNDLPSISTKNSHTASSTVVVVVFSYCLVGRNRNPTKDDVPVIYQAVQIITQKPVQFSLLCLLFHIVYSSMQCSSLWLLFHSFCCQE